MRNISQAELKADTEELRTLLLNLGRKRSFRDPVALVLEEMRFTPAQVHTLLWLGADGALTMGELATRLGITEKTITGVVDRLEVEDHVRRERSEADRRVVRVHLTRKGTGLHRRFQAALGEKLRLILGLLESSERRALIRIIEKISDRLPARPTKRTTSS